MYENALYVTANATPYEDNYAVYKIDLISGAVHTVISLDQDIREVEGLHIVVSPDDSSTVLMNILAIRDIDNKLLNEYKIRIAEVMSYQLRSTS